MNASYCALRSFMPIIKQCMRNQLILSKHLNKCCLNILQRRLNFSSQAVTSKTLKPTRIKLDSPQFRAIFTPEMKSLITIFEKQNHELRIVGGAVRDLLMQKQPLDIDFATTATPQQMKRMFTYDSEVFSTFMDIAENHGTVSVRIDDKKNFEISTLRVFAKDVDGNESKLKFTTDWRLDASRRDFTINSMFLGFDGTVYDYFNGIEDLEKRRVQFVGDAVDRIEEDYLRILRYFRFYGKIARDSNSHDPELLQVIKQNLVGLYGISGQRRWTELKKILSGNYKFDLMETMLNVNMALYIGLPLNVNFKEFEQLCERSAHLSLHPVTIITSLLNNEEDMAKFDTLMKLSNYERELGYFIIRYRNDNKLKENTLQLCKELVVLTTENVTHVRERIEQVLSYQGDEKLLNEFKSWEAPRFPVTGHHLVNMGIAYGRKIGHVKMAMKKRWLKSSFTLTEDDLLEKNTFNEILNEVNEEYQKTVKQGKKKNKKS